MTEKDVIGLYIRCSTAKQDVRTQKHALMEHCRKQLYPDHEIVSYVDDAVSGAISSRPALNKLLSHAASGKISKVIVFELSRLSRNMMDLLKLMEQLNNLSVSVETPEGPVKFDGTIQQFLVAAKALVAAEERERIRIRTREALAERKAAGVKLGARPGEQRRLGKRKDYWKDEPELVKKILKLKKRKLSTHAIAEAVSSPGNLVSQNKVCRIIRRCSSM